MKKSLIAAGAASVALAAMPVLGVFADDPAPTPSADQVATDTIQVTVDASCTFTAGSGTATYSASGTNQSGQVAPSASSSAVHNFTVFCNNNSGYHVTAVATALSQSGVTDDFDYVATLPSSGTDGAWHATIAGTGLKNQLPDGGASTTIIERSEASDAGGESFTATYSAWIGTATPAGTYEGTIGYTLASGV